MPELKTSDDVKYQSIDWERIKANHLNSKFEYQRQLIVFSEYQFPYLSTLNLFININGCITLYSVDNKAEDSTGCEVQVSLRFVDGVTDLFNRSEVRFKTFTNTVLIII